MIDKKSYLHAYITNPDMAGVHELLLIGFSHEVNSSAFSIKIFTITYS